MITNELDVDYRKRVYNSYRSTHGLDQVVDDRPNRAPYLRHLIANFFPQDRVISILDLGCGAGSLLYFLRMAGYQNCRGVDTSIEQVKAAAALGIEGVTQGDLFESLRYTPENSIDVIVAFDVIEHLTKLELLAFADEVSRVLQSGGRWIIHAPNADSPFGMSVRYRDWTHEQAFSISSINQVLKTSGFASVECYEDQPIPHGIKSMFRLLLWKLIRSCWRFAWAVETGYTDRHGVYSQNFITVAIK